MGSEMCIRDSYRRKWNKMYQRLVAYKNEHNGDAKVPRRYEQDPQLGHWVHTQRRFYKEAKMSDERFNLLDSIGFDWEHKPGSPQISWNEMYQRLVAYKNEHNGDAMVPRSYEQDLQLGNWVHTQRTEYNMSLMDKSEPTRILSSSALWMCM